MLIRVLSRARHDVVFFYFSTVDAVDRFCALQAGHYFFNLFYLYSRALRLIS